MHFSIPDTHELYADTTAATTTYTVYNIYINGNYHACLRYKQLHALHKQLRGQCAFEPEIHLPEFPPKRLLPLTNGQLETRRSALEHYLQLIGQDPRIARMPFFQQFLLRAQIDTALSECTIESDNECKKLDVLLATDTYDHNGGTGYQLQVNCCVNQNSSALLRNVGHALKLSPAMLQYFCLYLVRVQRPTQDSDDGDEDTLVLLRRLMDFESPYISRLHADPCQLMLRKCYWNPTWDLKLQRDPVALNLLYLQTVGDVTREWIIATPDVRHKLRSLEEHGMKKEYLEMARHLPLYGCLQFNTAIVDYPDPETSAIISIGNRELSIRTPRGAKIYETKFRVTRMRCWRVSAMHNTFESRDHPTHLQLSFEYLMSKQTLRWITITSTEAMLMSVSLQSMVDELLNSGGSNESGDELELHSNTARNGRTSASASSSSASSTPSSSTSTTASTCMPSTSSSSVSANYMSSYMSNSSNLSTPVSPTPPVQFLAQRVAPSSKQQNKLTTSSTFSAVFFRNNDSVSHNEAFEGIGDDDL